MCQPNCSNCAGHTCPQCCEHYLAVVLALRTCVARARALKASAVRSGARRASALDELQFLVDSIAQHVEWEDWEAARLAAAEVATLAAAESIHIEIDVPCLALYAFETRCPQVYYNYYTYQHAQAAAASAAAAAAAATKAVESIATAVTVSTTGPHTPLRRARPVPSYAPGSPVLAYRYVV